MSLKHTIAPMLGFGARVATRMFAGANPQFQIAILHDVAERDFAALIRFLRDVERERGFLKPAEIDNWLKPDGAARASAGRRPPCLLTFDDGFASALPVVRDILPQFDISAVFFVCPGLIDLPTPARETAVLQNVFRGMMPSQGVPSLMNWGDLAELQNAGHVVGAHGMNHIKLSAASQTESEAEILEAGACLERHLGRRPDWYAYAFGDIESISAPALQIMRSRYRYCRSGIRGSNDAYSLSGVLTAQEINLATPSEFQRAVLDGALDLRYISARRRLRAYTEMASA